jgi:hypothetical protein
MSESLSVYYCGFGPVKPGHLCQSKRLDEEINFWLQFQGSNLLYADFENNLFIFYDDDGNIVRTAVTNLSPMHHLVGTAEVT